MPENRPTQDLERALAAAQNAQYVRRHHARRTDKRSKQRQQDISVALDRIRDAMKPLKAEIGRFPYGPGTSTAETNREEIRAASLALQRERRKLWKMKERGGSA